MFLRIMHAVFANYVQIIYTEYFTKSLQVTQVVWNDTLE